MAGESLQGNISQAEIESLLDRFNQKCVEFGYYCDQYAREEVSIADITRYRTEATAEAEEFFGNHSLDMTMEQLQRYAVTQNSIEAMTSNLFRAEIDRNKNVICQALRNGEYFLVRITFNAVESNIYMMYSRDRITTDKERALKTAAEEQQLCQSLTKVLKAMEVALQADPPESIDYAKVEKAFEIYVGYFRTLADNLYKQASDDRVMYLLEQHANHLHEHNYFGNFVRALDHLSRCINLLKPVVRMEHVQRLDRIYERASSPWSDISDIQAQPTSL